MKRAWMWFVPAGLAVVATAIGVGPGRPEAQQQRVLVAKKTAAAPAVDGSMDDAWKGAAPLTVKAVGGKNFPGGSTEITLRSVYTADMLYLQVQYKDESDSVRRSPWVKQADGSWQQLKDPNDKGGDNNQYNEDKLGMLWNISSPAFEQRGCMSACHTGEGKPYGNKYTPSDAERLDMWHWKGVRTAPVGQVDDQYVGGTRYDAAKAPEAGRKSDPKTGGGYADNARDDKKGPRVALKDNRPAPPYWIVEGEKEAFDDGKYKAGDEVPGIIVAPLTGDRGDIAATAVWKAGVRTLVIARKLVTGSEYDVQFSDLRKEYVFGVAAFDNAQVRHAYVPTALKLKFD